MFKPNNGLVQDIDRWIESNKERFVEDLDRLVRIPSISEQGNSMYPFGKNCANVLDEMKSLAEKYGFNVDNHEYYCGSLLVRGSGQFSRRIGLFAHLDVVPFGEGWHYEPLRCTLHDGILIGRGVGDNKGPGICVLYALRYLKEHDINLKNDILVYYGLSEETGMDDIKYFCKTQHVPDLNLVVDTNFPVCYGEKGLMRADIEQDYTGNLIYFHAGSVVNVIPDKAEAVIRGVNYKEAKEKIGDIQEICVDEEGESVKVTAIGISRHAAFPEGSTNALHILAKALTKSRLLNGSASKLMEGVATMTSDYNGYCCEIPFEDKESGKLTCVGSVACASNGRIKVSFDARYPVTVDEKQVVNGFKHCAESFGFKVTIKELSEPAYVSLDKPYISTLCEICDYVQGKHYEPYTMGGGTYARHLPSAIGFGPGIPDAPNPFETGHGQAHQPDECVPLDVLLKGVKTYILSLLELDNII